MEHTRFEKARIIGARALQLKMGARPLVKGTNNILCVIEMAEREYEKEILPINVMRNT